MSGSPKYSTVRANALRAQQIEAERRRREQLRKAEQTRRAQQALDTARAAVAQRLARLTAAVKALHALAGVDPVEFERVRAALDQARALLDAARDPQAVTRADRAVTDAEVLRTTAATNAMRHTRNAGRQQLTVIRSLLGELTTRDRIAFDSAGRRAADRAVSTLDGVLAHGSTEEIARATVVCAETVRTHHATVTAAVAERTERIHEVSATITESEARIRDLRHAVDHAGLHVGDLTAASEVLGEIRVLLQHDVATALDFSRQLPARLDRMEREADDAIDRATERREMLTEIVTALPELGFAVDPASLVFGEDGSVALRAHPRRGEPVLIAVHDDAQERHRVNYMRTGDRDAPLDNGSCDSLLTVAEQVNAALRQGGYDTGDLHWDDGASGPRTPGAARRLRPADSAPDSRTTS